SSAGTGTDAVDINATAGGLDIDALNTSDISVTAADQTLTLATTGAGTSKLILSSAGTGTDAVDINATAGGLDIDALNTSEISVTAADQTLTLAAAGAGASKLILSSAGTGADAIEFNTTAGGITAKVVDEKDLVLGNAEGNAYFKVAASDDAANEIVEIKNTSGDDAGAITLSSVAGGVAINAGLGLTIDAAAELAINSSTNKIKIGNNDVDFDIDIGTMGERTTTIGVDQGASGVAIASGTGGVTVTSTAGSLTLNGTGQTVDLNSAALDIDASGEVTIDISAPADANPGSSISLTAGSGGASGDQNGGNIVLTPGTKNDSGNDGFVAINGPTTSTAGLFLSPNNAAVADRWKITAAADGTTLIMSSFSGADAEAAVLTLTEGGNVTVEGTLTANSFDGNMTSDENESDNAMTIRSNLGEEAALTLETPTGGIDINAAATKNITIDGGQILINSLENTPSAISLTTDVGATETIVVNNKRGETADAVKLLTNKGGIDVDVNPVIGLLVPTLAITNNSLAATQDLIIEQKGPVDASLLLSSAGTGIDAIGLTATAGDISITHPTGKKVLYNTNTAGTISHESNAEGQDFTIEQLGSVDASLLLKSEGTGTDAIWINANAGGLDVDALNTSAISVTAAAQTLTVEAAGAGAS
ncbi:uncharacterized protein METZ01_LOCUS177528, partial [marine metagenome]